MSFKRRAAVTGILLTVALLLPGCGPRPRGRVGMVTGPGFHYSRGLQRLEMADLDAALEEFERARSLDPDFAGAYVGIALVEMERGDFERALQQVKTAKEKDVECVDAYITAGRILTRRRRGDDWLEQVVREYDKALRIAPDNSAAYFYKGESYKAAYKFSKAAEAYTLAARLKGQFSERARSERQMMLKIQKAAPQTQMGMRIALKDKINRADLAVLLLEELKLKKMLAERGRVLRRDLEPAEILDIAGHWARDWIEDVVCLQIMGLEVFPDGTFKPEESITKVNFALIAQSVLLLLYDDPQLATRYFGERSPFPDIRSDDYAYNAVALCVERGIMHVEPDGSFGPFKHVSGADALLGIRRLRESL